MLGKNKIKISKQMMAVSCSFLFIFAPFQSFALSQEPQKDRDGVVQVKSKKTRQSTKRKKTWFSKRTVASVGGLLALFGGGFYVYLNRDSIRAWVIGLLGTYRLAEKQKFAVEVEELSKRFGVDKAELRDLLSETDKKLSVFNEAVDQEVKRIIVEAFDSTKNGFAKQSVKEQVNKALEELAVSTKSKVQDQVENLFADKDSFVVASLVKHINEGVDKHFGPEQYQAVIEKIDGALKDSFEPGTDRNAAFFEAVDTIMRDATKVKVEENLARILKDKFDLDAQGKPGNAQRDIETKIEAIAQKVLVGLFEQGANGEASTFVKSIQDKVFGEAHRSSSNLFKLSIDGKPTGVVQKIQNSVETVAQNIVSVLLAPSADGKPSALVQQIESKLADDVISDLFKQDATGKVVDEKNLVLEPVRNRIESGLLDMVASMLQPGPDGAKSSFLTSMEDLISNRVRHKVIDTEVRNVLHDEFLKIFDEYEKNRPVNQVKDKVKKYYEIVKNFLKEE